MAPTFSTVIVVPIYRAELSDSEYISLDRCQEIWGNCYDIVIIAPAGLDITAIEKKYNNFSTVRVDAKMMSSIRQYNKMLLDRHFYSLFNSYDYMLIYQSDCYVFEDRLSEWVERGYDYVGAPWYYDLGGFGWFKRFIGRVVRSIGVYHTNWFKWGEVGNGGFSLRRVSVFLEKCADMRLSRRAQRGRLNEDIYWSMVAKLRKPSAEEASHFCADMTPVCYPDDVMAVHGWNKSSQTREFWKGRTGV